MLNIAVQQLDRRYFSRLKKPQAFCRSVVKAAWREEGPAEVSVVLADDVFVHDLNFRYREKDCSTNVLSFENAERPPKGFVWLAGDIIIAYETVLKEARAQGKTFESHFAHLLIHGTLHLQGYDHLEEKQAQKMERLEKKIMKKMGYDDPYKDVI